MFDIKNSSATNRKTVADIGSYNDTLDLMSYCSNFDFIPSKPSHTIQPNQKSLLCLDFNSRDILATGGSDSTIKIWNVSTG